MSKEAVDMLHYERKAWKKNLTMIAGVDEAGRGPLAGPVVAAAVIFDKNLLAKGVPEEWQGLTDSKKLSEKKREFFYEKLMSCTDIHWAVGMVSPEEIDEMNILEATHKAMRQVLEALPEEPELALIDGRPVPKLPCFSEAIIKGDSLSLSIAAASVIAKVTRDHMMLQLHETYPVYGFDTHKGYGTVKHMEALQHFGPCPSHRRSFRPVREAIEPRPQQTKLEL